MVAVAEHHQPLAGIAAARAEAGRARLLLRGRLLPSEHGDERVLDATGDALKRERALQRRARCIHACSGVCPGADCLAVLIPTRMA